MVLSIGLCALPFLLLFNVIPVVLAGLPSKVYGVNLGSWLVLEPWMLPQGWKDMGGESCDVCSTCIASEFAFAKAYPDTVDAIFDKHWSSWFTQEDVNNLKSWGINTVRIPLGYWLVEPLIDRSKEYYPRGGIKQLKRGLRQLQAAGIKVILVHHAAPGVQTPDQQFSGRCTTDVQFYTDYNYHRALVWTAVMTALAHIDADFGSAAALQAVNEPIMDASKTPGYGNFQKNFVKVVRAVETLLDIIPSDSRSPKELTEKLLPNTSNATATLLGGESYGGAVGRALVDAAPMLAELAGRYGFGSILDGDCPNKEPLVTTFMDIKWQNNNPPNPADAASGAQAYDSHLYYSFGGVADANEEAYLKSICNLRRVQDNENMGNTPLIFGEWSLATQFDPSDEFLRKWADAQKRVYSTGGGWVFWSYKIEKSKLSGGTARVWSYREGIERGYLTKDPTKLHDTRVCDAFMASGKSKREQRTT